MEKHRIQSKENYKRKKENKYHKKYYHKNKGKYREQLKLYSRLRHIRETLYKVRDCIQIKTVNKIGNGCYITLPRNWNGREVVVFDNKFFMLHIVKRRDHAKKKA